MAGGLLQSKTYELAPRAEVTGCQGFESAQ